jgi:D-mannonate dehydratase
MDSGDKASNKAMSAAYKYAAFQAFCIPTEGDNDADSTTHEVAVAAIDPGIEQHVQLSQTVEELNNVWKSLSAEQRKTHLPIFSTRKTQLSGK